MLRKTHAQDMENTLLDSNDGYSHTLFCNNKRQVCCMFVSYSICLGIGFVWGIFSGINGDYILDGSN